MALNLIIQGRDIPTPTLKQLAKLAHADEIRAWGPGAFCLAGADAGRKDAVAAQCEAQRLDWGYVPEERKLRDFGLLVMDMDSTLITIECIDEIADMLALKPQVAAITEAAMRGEIDFAESLRRRVSLLRGLQESALARVYEERLRLTGGAETLLDAAKRAGVRTLLVSGGFTYFTERLKARLTLDATAANTLEIVDGRLTGRVLGPILDAAGKAARLAEMRATLGLAAAQVVAIGDGANDLKMMAEAGVSIAFHAKPVVRAQASYALSFCTLEGVLPLLGEPGSRRAA